ncbi:hypothetical protein XOCgx_3955 [Xanthomonas oryzae pv. oryzicola]|nr:hypothetical protein XOCgx_3955 [Xanthomonas oryzae pv. oryzicola]
MDGFTACHASGEGAAPSTNPGFDPNVSAPPVTQQDTTDPAFALRVANKTTALTARRARPVLGIGMDPASTAGLSAPSAPT